MMKKGKRNKKTRELVLRSFDAPLQDQRSLERAMKDDDLRVLKDEIREIRNTLSESAKTRFQPGFAGRVLNRLAENEARNGIEPFYSSLKAAFRSVALIGLIVLIGLALFNIGTGDIFSSEEIVYAAETTFEDILGLPIF